MPTPLDGLKIKIPGNWYHGEKGDFQDLDFAVLSIGPSNYIYYHGDILGPVERAIQPVEVGDRSDDKEPTKVVMFGQGKQVGLYVNGVKSELFDEIGSFNDWRGHRWYVAKRDYKWCYVIDGVIHGWYDRVDKNGWVGFQGQKPIFYAMNVDGQVGYWLNDQPLELFEADTYDVSDLQCEGKHIAFRVTRNRSWAKHTTQKEGIWYDGKVDRWFESIERRLFSVYDGGLRYTGVDYDPVGRFLFYKGEYLGPYDKIEWWHSGILKLRRGTLVAVFTKKNKQFIRIGNWTSKEHKEIKDPVVKDGHTYRFRSHRLKTLLSRFLTLRN